MLVTSLWTCKSGEKVSHGWCPEKFNSPEEAEKYWEKNYRDRKEGDQYDEHWNNLPLMIDKFVYTRERVVG